MFLKIQISINLFLLHIYINLKCCKTVLVWGSRDRVTVTQSRGTCSNKQQQLIWF